MHYSSEQKRYIAVFMQHIRLGLAHDNPNNSWINYLLGTTSQGIECTTSGMQIVKAFSIAVGIAGIVSAPATLGASIGLAGAIITVTQGGYQFYQVAQTLGKEEVSFIPDEVLRESATLAFEILFEEVATLLAIQYRFFIEDKATNAGIDSLAIFAAKEVMKQWLSLTREDQLISIEALLAPLYKSRRTPESLISVKLEEKILGITTERYYATGTYPFAAVACLDANTIPARWTSYHRDKTKIEYGYRTSLTIPPKHTAASSPPNWSVISPHLSAQFFITDLTIQRVKDYLLKKRANSSAESLNDYLSKLYGVNLIATCHDNSLQQIGDLSEGDFSYVNFRRVDLRRCILTNTRWNEAHLTHALFGNPKDPISSVFPSPLLLVGSQFNSAHLEASFWENVDFSNALFSNTRMKGATLVHCQLGNLQHPGCQWDLAQWQDMQAPDIHFLQQLKDEQENRSQLKGKLENLTQTVSEQTQKLAEFSKSVDINEHNLHAFNQVLLKHQDDLYLLKHQNNTLLITTNTQITDLEKRLTDLLETLAACQAAQDSERSLLIQTKMNEWQAQDLARQADNQLFQITLTNIQKKLKVHEEHIGHITSEVRTQKKRIEALEQRFAFDQNITGAWSHLVHPRDMCFQPRARLWSQLESRFSKTSFPIILSGATGMGKTSLASEWMHEQKARGNYPNIRWVDMDSSQQQISLENWAKDLGLFYKKKSVTGLWEIITAKIANQSWFIIFDNVENLASIPERWSKFSLTSQQRILIISLDDTWSNSIEVDVYTVEESLNYIQQQMNVARHPGFDIASAESLAIHLGRYPFALQLAMGQLCVSHEVSLSDYLKKLCSKGLNTLKVEDRKLPSQAHLNKHETLTAIWRARLQPLPAEIRDLLYFLSFIDSKGSINLLSDWFSKDETRLKETLLTLREQNLIKITIENHQTMWHIMPLMQEIIREEAIEALSVNNKHYWKTFLTFGWDVLNKNIPSTINSPEDSFAISSNITHVSKLWLQVKKLLDNHSLTRQNLPTDDWQAKLLKKIAQGEEDLSHFTSAEKYFLESLAAFQGLYPENNHVDIAILYLNLGNICYYQNKWSDAERHYNLALTIANNLPKDPLIQRLISMTRTNLAELHQLYKGDTSEAIKSAELSEKMYLESYEEMRQTYQNIETTDNLIALNTTKEDLARTRISLSGFYFDKGNAQLAIDTAKLALNMFCDLNHPAYIAKALNSYGRSFLGKDNEGAGTHIDKSLEQFRNIHRGKNAHIDIINVLHSYGEVFLAKKEYEHALEKFGEALSMLRILADETGAPFNSIDTFYVLQGLGEAFLQLNNLPKAQENFDAAFTLLHALYGDSSTHPKIAHTYYKFGNIYEKKGQITDAKSNYTQAIDMYKRLHINLPNNKQYLEASQKIQEESWLMTFRIEKPRLIFQLAIIGIGGGISRAHNSAGMTTFFASMLFHLSYAKSHFIRETALMPHLGFFSNFFSPDATAENVHSEPCSTIKLHAFSRKPLN